MVDIKRETYFYKDLKDMPYQKASKSPQFDAAEAAAEPHEETQDDDDADAELLRNFPKPPSKPQDKIVNDEQHTEDDGEVTDDGETTDTTDGDTTDTTDGEVQDEDGAVDGDTTDGEVTDVPPTDVQSDDTPADDVASDGQVEDGAEDGQVEDGTETGDDEISDETDGEIQPETRLEDPAPVAKDVQPETKLVDKAPEISERPVDDVRKKEPPVSKEPDLPPFDAVDEPEKAPLPDEKPNTDIQIDQLQDDEVSEQVPSEKQSHQRREPRVKTRAQMNKHARLNKKAHMNKGKKKGTESEEEPWWSDYEDEWIRTKMENMRRKGLV